MPTPTSVAELDFLGPTPPKTKRASPGGRQNLAPTNIYAALYEEDDVLSDSEKSGGDSEEAVAPTAENTSTTKSSALLVQLPTRRKLSNSTKPSEPSPPKIYKDITMEDIINCRAFILGRAPVLEVPQAYTAYDRYPPPSERPTWRRIDADTDPYAALYEEDGFLSDSDSDEYPTNKGVAAAPSTVGSGPAPPPANSSPSGECTGRETAAAAPSTDGSGPAPSPANS